MTLSTKQLEDEAKKTHNFIFRNNRGVFQKSYKDKHGTVTTSYIRCGVPEPKGKEDADDFKGGDFIGFTDVLITAEMVGKTLPVYTNVEIKGPGDRLKVGQKRWHNLILLHNGISEIWTNKKIIKEPLEWISKKYGKFTTG